MQGLATTIGIHFGQELGEGERFAISECNVCLNLLNESLSMQIVPDFNKRRPGCIACLRGLIVGEKEFH